MKIWKIIALLSIVSVCHAQVQIGKGVQVGGTGSGGGATLPTNAVVYGTSSTTSRAAVAADVTAMWSGPCTGTNVLRADGTCGAGTGSVSINGTSVSNPNINDTTPAAGTNGLNVTWQHSGSNVSGEIVGDGNAAHFLNGTGAFSTPAGGGGLSGQTINCAPKANSATTSTSSLPICDDGTTTTLSHPTQINGSLGVDDGTGHGGGFSNATEGTAPTAGSGYETFWADSASHRWKFNPNNAGAFFVPGIASAGTSGNCLQLAANGIDIVDAGSACGGGGGSTQWSSLTNPATDLSLAMATYTSIFTWNPSAGATDQFSLTDTASDPNTGNLFSLSTQTSSALNPFAVYVAGSSTPALQVQPSNAVAYSSLVGNGSDPYIVLPSNPSTAAANGKLYNNAGVLTFCNASTCIGLGAGSGISGLTSGYIPLAGSSTTLTGNSPIDYGITTASVMTGSAPLYLTSSANITLSVKSSNTTSSAIEFWNTSSGSKKWDMLVVGSGGSGGPSSVGDWDLYDNTDSSVELGVKTTGIYVPSTNFYGWGVVPSGSIDTMFSRPSAGNLSLDTSTPGNHLGNLSMNNLTVASCTGCGGGGSGAWTNLTGTVTVSGCTASSGTCTVGTPGATIVFSSIPSGYNQIVIIGTAESSQAGLDTDYLQFNSDTGSNYVSQITYSTNATVAAGGTTSAVAQAPMNFVNGTNGGNNFSPVSVQIPNYLSTAFNKHALGTATAWASSGIDEKSEASTRWNNTAAITSVTLGFTSASNFVAGSTFAIYGVN